MTMTIRSGNKSNKISTCNQAVSKDAWLFFCIKNALPNEISGERFDLNKFLSTYYIKSLTVSREIDRRLGLPILHAPDKLREFVVHRIEFMRDGQVFGPAVAVFQGDAFRVADAVDFDCADFALDFTWQRGIGNLRIGDDRFFVAVVQDHAALAVGACRQPVIILEE